MRWEAVGKAGVKGARKGGGGRLRAEPMGERGAEAERDEG